MSMSFKASPDGTYGEILVNGQVVAKLPVTGNAVIPNLVGTVSQSGGIPTGAIIERGSNANGEYVRFADGTQICWGVVSVASIDIVTGSGFISPVTDYTLPAAMVGSYRYMVNSVSFGGTFGSTEAGSTASVIKVRLMRLVSHPTSAAAQIHVIGRWY